MIKRLEEEVKAQYLRGALPLLAFLFEPSFMLLFFKISRARIFKSRDKKRDLLIAIFSGLFRRIFKRFLGRSKKLDFFQKSSNFSRFEKAGLFNGRQN